VRRWIILAAWLAVSIIMTAMTMLLTIVTAMMSVTMVPDVMSAEYLKQIFKAHDFVQPPL